MTMATQVQLVFGGEVLEGFRADEVRRRVGEKLKLDDQGAARLFATPRTVLKRAIAHDEAQRYVELFARLGARLHVEALAPAPVQPAPASPNGAAAAPAAPVFGPPLTSDVEEIVCPNCSERQPKRILCRNCATDMPMAIAHRQEAMAAERAARRAEFQARHKLKSLKETPLPTDDGIDAPRLWGLGFSGRMGRLVYWTGGTLVLLMLYLLLVFALMKPGSGRWTLFGLGLLVFLFSSLRMTVLRLHDLNASGWWSVLMLVPTVGSAGALVVSFVPGSMGDNDHGEPARRGRWLHLLGAVAVSGLCLTLTLPDALANATQLMIEVAGEEALAEGGEEAEPTMHPRLPSAAAAEAFYGPYVASPPFKAFAMSPSGPWGWSAGAPSLERAVAAAIDNCEKYRRPGMATCEAIDSRVR